MKEFVIPFFGLKEGKHTYKFNIDRSFFEAFESTLLEDAAIEVILEFEKMSNMLVLSFDANGSTHIPCDRCGDFFDMPVDASERLIVKFGDEPFEQTDEIIVLEHDQHEIDVSQEIYEMLILSLPRKRVHARKKDCNQEALNRLGSNKSDKENTIDPRWEALKKLKN
jgi:uncharacterized metal-binding protein YceD (DUF177 family)